MERIPKSVLNTIQESAKGDSNAIKRHRAMSRKGGIQAGKLHALKKMIETVHLEDAQLAEAKMGLTPDGDSHPPDQKLLDSLEEEQSH